MEFTCPGQDTCEAWSACDGKIGATCRLLLTFTWRCKKKYNGILGKATLQRWETVAGATSVVITCVVGSFFWLKLKWASGVVSMLLTGTGTSHCHSPSHTYCTIYMTSQDSPDRVCFDRLLHHVMNIFRCKQCWERQWECLASRSWFVILTFDVWDVCTGFTVDPPSVTPAHGCWVTLPLRKPEWLDLNMKCWFCVLACDKWD